MSNPIERDRREGIRQFSQFGAKKQKGYDAKISRESAGLAAYSQQRKIDQMNDENKKKPKDFLVKQVIEWLRKQYDREGHHYAHMSVKEIMMGTQEKIDIDQLGLRVKVSEHARVRFDEDSHSFVYVPKFPGVTCKQHLVGLLGDNKFGLYQEDVETCYLVDKVKEDIEELIEDELLHREDNKEEKKQVIFRTEEGGRLAENVTEGVKELWFLVGSELPKNPKDVELQLSKVGLKPIRQKELAPPKPTGRGRGRGRGRKRGRI